MTIALYKNQSVHCLSISSKRFAIHSMLLVAMTACASKPPLPTASERTSDIDYNARPAYNKPYSVKGKTYYPLLNAAGYIERGIASWYGAESGNRTAMGSRFNPDMLTAAHKTLPLPCKVRVTNLQNGRSITVLVNDRGPFHGTRLIDLSRAAAERLGVKGLANVEVQYLGEVAEDS